MWWLLFFIRIRFKRLFESGIYEHQNNVKNEIGRWKSKSLMRNIINNNIENVVEALHSIKFSDTDSTSLLAIKGILFISCSFCILALIVFILEICLSCYNLLWYGDFVDIIDNHSIKFSETDATSLLAIKGILFISCSFCILALIVFILEICLSCYNFIMIW